MNSSLMKRACQFLLGGTRAVPDTSLLDDPSVSKNIRVGRAYEALFMSSNLVVAHAADILWEYLQEQDEEILNLKAEVRRWKGILDDLRVAGDCSCAIGDEDDTPF